jgi:branched-chain amino acid transport system ATP-binding protein
VSLQVESGDALALLGRNGMGKTTLIKCLTGVISAASGYIEVGGQQVKTNQPHKIIQQGVGYVPEGRGLFYDLTVKENLEVAQRKVKKPFWTFSKVYELFPILKDRVKQKAGTLSGGQQQMLAIARALMNEPNLLILDEPTLGLAPAIVRMLGEVLPQINNEGVTILMVEQNLSLALTVCNKIALMDKGKIVYEKDKSLAKDDLSELQQLLGLSGI